MASNIKEEKRKSNNKNQHNSKKKIKKKNIEIKQRRPVKYTKKDKKTKLGFLIGGIFLILLCYIFLDLYCAIIMALGIAIIVGIAEILKRLKNKRRKKKVFISLLIIVLTLGILCLLGLSGFLIYVKMQADPLFETANLETPENTTLLDINGNEYAKLGSEMREKVKYDQLPDVLIDAIVATEDSRFFQHNGFDAPRFLKAAIGQALGRQDAGGASTLTMQVVKNSITDHYAERTSGVSGIIRKFEDIYIAIFKLEKNYTKEQIIEYYVNNHYLGGNVYGVQEASEVYFGKNVSELNLSEASILAGMFKSPYSYRPTDHPENAEKRRATVLYLMRKHGYITKEEEQLANSIPVTTLIADQSSSKTNEFQGYIDTVVDEIKEKYGINAYTTSLLVYTNLDPERQRAVNRVLSGEAYSWIDDKVQTGVSVIESDSGKILAIGNGRNVNGREQGTIGQLNYATDIKRQPGSTAKPLFDYGPGIEFNNWSTYTLFDDTPYNYSNGRSIKNWDGGYYGTITLRKALSTSRNIPALKAFQQVDNEKIVEFVTNLGLHPEIENGKIHEAHSIGAFTGTNPLEMSAAYAAFSNGGTYHDPYSVNKIVFKSTGEVKEHKEIAVSTKVMSPETAFMISSVLQNVSLTGGTPYNVACKTGTTNFDDNTMNRYHMPYDAIRDSWVIGYSTKTTIGMWYGYDTFNQELINQGYVLHNVPATIQKDKLFIALVNAGAMEYDRSSFVEPEGVVKVGIENGTNPPKLANPYSQNVIYEYFKKDYVPTETYESLYVDTPANFKATYNESSNQITFTWDAVNKPYTSQDYGTFGYNIYQGSTLIGFTSKTNYKYTPKGSPYGTYKIIATFKSYSEIQSNPATYNLEEQSKFDINSCSLVYNGSTSMPTNGLLSINDSNIEIRCAKKPASITIKHITPNQITTPGTHNITVTIMVNGETYDLSTSINVTEIIEEKE